MRFAKFSGSFPALLCLFVTVSTSLAIGQGLPALSMNSGVVSQWRTEPWPAVRFGSFRLWDTDTFWYEVNPSEGNYDWTMMDLWLAKAKEHHDHVLYTLGFTPGWASSNRHDNSCIGGPGVCDPPNDLNADGTGPDQHWKDYVTAVATHSKNSNTAHIEAWELWDEPWAPWEWAGTIPQIVRMSKDAYNIIKSIDPNAIVLTPSFDWGWKLPLNYMASFFAQGGGQYSDAISLHGYVFDPGGKHGEPENLVKYYPDFYNVLKSYNQNHKPIWDTEASWGSNIKSHFSDPDLQAGWVARFFLLHRSASIARLFWFEWNSTSEYAPLWKPNPKDHRLPGTLLKPGKAYGEVANWLNGTHMPSKCSSTGAVWQCSLTGGGGYEAQAIWNTSKSCSNGNCKTVNYKVGSQFVNYRNLDGKTTPIKNNTVPIGYKPILVQNQ